MSSLGDVAAPVSLFMGLGERRMNVLFPKMKLGSYLPSPYHRGSDIVLTTGLLKAAEEDRKEVSRLHDDVKSRVAP